MEIKSRFTLYHSLAFWLGTLAIVAGVGCHLRDFIAARDMHYQLCWMPMSEMMSFGMVLIVTGIAATVYGLFPARHKKTKTRVPTSSFIQWTMQS